MNINNVHFLLYQIVLKLRREVERENERAFRLAGWWMEGGEG